MRLREENLPGRTMERAPRLDPALQRAQLAALEAPPIVSLQMIEQGLGFQARVEQRSLPRIMARSRRRTTKEMSRKSFHSSRSQTSRSKSLESAEP